MKKCELCKNPARTYCESDQASLCWNCDAKVHGANFLVARHSRALLCQSCQSLTPWKASGAQLGHTVSVCERCMDSNENNTTRELQEQDGSDDPTENDEEYSDSDSSDDGGGGDNQVVPWSSSPTTPPPPPPPESASSSFSCTSTSDDNDGDVVESENASVSFKRQRLQDDLERSTPLRMRVNAAATVVDWYTRRRSLKGRRRELDRPV